LKTDAPLPGFDLCPALVRPAAVKESSTEQSHHIEAERGREHWDTQVIGHLRSLMEDEPGDVVKGWLKSHGELIKLFIAARLPARRGNLSARKRRRRYRSAGALQKGEVLPAARE